MKLSSTAKRFRKAILFTAIIWKDAAGGIGNGMSGIRAIRRRGKAYLNALRSSQPAILRQQLQSELFPNGDEQPQLLLRLGYAAPLPFARRRPLHEVMQS